MRFRLLPLLLLLALGLGAAPRQGGPERAQAPRVYRWKDDKGKMQITNTPPPPGAELLPDAPPPLALEADRGDRLVVRQSGRAARAKATDLTPEQTAAWEALDKAMGDARKQGNRRTMEAVVALLIDQSRWSNGLGFVALLPLVALALMALLGWWIAYNLPRLQRQVIIGAFTLSGVVMGQILLSHFLYRPQFFRLQLNLTLLTDHYLGGDLRVGPKNREALRARWAALEAATDPLNAPWRFPAEVEALEDTLKRVVVEP
jgi:hypothetical protein